MGLNLLLYFILRSTYLNCDIAAGELPYPGSNREARDYRND